MSGTADLSVKLFLMWRLRRRKRCLILGWLLLQ